MAETGRLFIRNLSYACTEADLKKLFETYGPLAEVALIIDKVTKKSKAIAYVTYVLAIHAVQAFTSLDGNTFQGRLLHILPAKAKATYDAEASASIAGPTAHKQSFKQNKDKEAKDKSGDGFNWNTLFMRSDTVASAMAATYGVSKGEVLDPEADGLAVRMALGETHIVAENTDFLRKQGSTINYNLILLATTLKIILTVRRGSGCV